MDVNVAETGQNGKFFGVESLRVKIGYEAEKFFPLRFRSRYYLRFQFFHKTPFAIVRGGKTINKGPRRAAKPDNTRISPCLRYLNLADLPYRLKSSFLKIHFQYYNISPAECQGRAGRICDFILRKLRLCPVGSFQRKPLFLLVLIRYAAIAATFIKTFNIIPSSFTIFIIRREKSSRQRRAVRKTSNP